MTITSSSTHNLTSTQVRLVFLNSATQSKVASSVPLILFRISFRTSVVHNKLITYQPSAERNIEIHPRFSAQRTILDSHRHNLDHLTGSVHHINFPTVFTPILATLRFYTRGLRLQPLMTSEANTVQLLKLALEK